MSVIRFRLALAVVSALALAPYLAVAQSVFQTVQESGPVRDAVIDAATGDMYLAVYGVNQVLRIDAATKISKASATVGGGPTAIALSANGQTLACVNRLDGTVSLIQTADMSVSATVAAGKGACDVTQLENGSFAVANSFADSITLIDPAHPDTPQTVEGVTGVPSAIAASGNQVAVTTRAPASVVIYTAGEKDPSTTISLPATPAAIAALTRGQFVVATDAGALLVNANDGSARTVLEGTVQSVASAGGACAALAGSNVVVFNDQGNETGRYAVPEAGQALAFANGLVVVLSPKNKSWHWAAVEGLSIAPAMVVAEAATAEQAEEAAPDSTAAAAPTPVVVEETKVEQEAAPVPQPVQAEIAPATAPATDTAPISEPAETPVPMPDETHEAQEPEPAPAVAAAPASPQDISTVSTDQPASESDSDSVATEETNTVTPGEPTLKADATSAKPMSNEPRPSRIRPEGFAPPFDPKPPVPPSKRGRPAAVPFAEGTEPTLSQGIGQQLQGIDEAEGGFEPVDWNAPLKNIKAEVLDYNPDTRIIEAQGNARFRVETISFASDYFYYNENTGELHMRGNVEIVQGPSTAFADEIKYIFPPKTEESAPPPLTSDPENLERDMAASLYALGSIEATNIEIIEPQRHFVAQHMYYDFLTQTGEGNNVEGQTGQVRFGGEKIQITGENAAVIENIWLTTCDCDHEYYRIRLNTASIGEGGTLLGKGARLEIGKAKTPVYWPRWKLAGAEAATVGFDFDSGRRAELGYYINVGQQFAVNQNVSLGLRLYPTTKEGVGFGVDGEYDFTMDPTAPLFGGKGEFHTLYTTQNRSYLHWYHRHQLYANTQLLTQVEQWSDPDIYKDFYYDQFQDRSEPRSFANVTHVNPAYIATGTVRVNPHGFVAETERAPELTFHLLERRLADNLYFTFDTINGYNEREPGDTHSARSVNVGRLTYDIDMGEAWNLAPFVEAEAAWYSNTVDGGDSDGRLSALTGVTLQTRLHRNYGGIGGFTGFKHIIVPSMTVSYRPTSNLDVEDTPRFDAYDNVYGRTRLETKIDNIVLGQDADSGESWQVARLSLYHGADIWNELRESEDYEVELDLRPRPYWGFHFIGEMHHISNDRDLDFDEPYFVQRAIVENYDRYFDADPETAFRYNAQYGDYERALAYFYYDDRPYGGKYSGRIGFSYTQTDDQVFNREIIYGFGYKANEKWTLSFEHRYDLEKDELTRQKYEIRRAMQCVETAINVTQRESGWDMGFELSVTAFPGTRLKF
ncbi:MAG: hypothetical protein AMXMBFR84_44180 [Candidatus Hydrogenedentota bacterium]